MFESPESVTGMIGESGAVNLCWIGILKLLAAKRQISGQCYYLEMKKSGATQKKADDLSSEA